jgi:hypothetical protein
MRKERRRGKYYFKIFIIRQDDDEMQKQRLLLEVIESEWRKTNNLTKSQPLRRDFSPFSPSNSIL